MKLSFFSIILSAAVISSSISVKALDKVDFSSELSELENLMEQCERLDIPTDYEMINYTVIKRFEKYVNEDIEDNKNYADYNITCLEELYNEARNNLEEYIAGTKIPFEVTRADTRSIYNNGSALYDKNGSVFSIGYGHFTNAQEDVGIFQNFGVNNIQMEIGPRYLKKQIPGWEQSSSGDIDAEINITDVLAESDKHSLKIKNKTGFTANTFTRIYQNVACKPNTKYKFGCKSRGNTVDYLWMSANGYSDRNYIEPSSMWKENTFYYTTAQDQTSLVFQLLSEAVTTVYVDNFYLIEIDDDNNEVSGNLLSNPGFEETDLYRNSVGYIINTLENAEKNNIGVSLLLSPHYFPDNLSKDIYTDKGGFIKYNINAEEAREVIEDYLRTLLPYIQGYSSLQNICISNEPTFSTVNFYDFYNPQFKEYLKSMHGSIENLNEEYKTDYSGFDEINMPMDLSEHNAVCYDWIEFNDRVFTDWHKWMADIIKEYLPDVPLHSKMMGYFDDVSESDTRDYLARGTDLELFAEFSDYAGNDTWDYIDRPGMYYKTMFLYDYQRSVTGKPVYNSEDHIIADRAMGYNIEQRNHVINNLWQGSVHGRSLSTIWVWERSKDPLSDFYTGFLTRPDCVAAVGKTNLDLARLSGEVSALQQDKPKAALFYSKPTRLYNAEYSKSLMQVYKTILESGFKVGIISDKSIESLSDYEILIVPNALNCRKETLKAAESFIKSGKKLFYSGDVFSKDEYNNQQDNTYIIENGLSFDNISDSKLEELLNNSGIMRVALLDRATDKAPKDVDWQYIEQDGEFLINIANLKNGTVKNIDVYIDGIKIDSLTECISGKEVPFVTAVCDLPQLIKCALPKYTEAEIDNIATDIENKLILWERKGSDYIGANVYTVTDNGAIDFEGMYTEDYFGGELGKTYLVRAINEKNNESMGKIITLTDEKPIEIEKFEYRVNNGYAVCDIYAANTTRGFVSAVIAVQTFDANSKRINYIHNKITFSPFAGSSVRISIPVSLNCRTIQAGALDGSISENLYSDLIIKQIISD